MKNDTKIRVAFFDAKQYDRDFFSPKLDNSNIELIFFESRLSPNNAELTRGFDAVCLFVNDSVDRTISDILYNNGIRLIALRSAGYNNVDLRAVYEKIPVVRVPDYSPYAVAEHAIALILTLNRKTNRAYFRTRDGNFTLNGLLGFTMKGKSCGIIGTGKIGRIAAEILCGFGLKVLAYDPYPNQEWAKEKNITYVSLEDLYTQSDIISLHCPLTPENVHLIDRNAIEKMKKGVMIINTGRGKLIETKALIAGLKDRHIGSAGLDVYEEETEYFFEDFSNSILEDDDLARLLTFSNVLLTSHQAFFTQEAMENISSTTLENILLFFEKDQLPNEICYKCGGPCKKKTEGRCFK